MKIKGFDNNLCCRGMQFEIGKEYKIDLDGRPMKLCSNTVFHYCDSLTNVSNFYNVLSDNRYCEIEVLGDEITDGEKCGSNHIKIIREITGEELNKLKCLTNGNTGIFNSGHYNSGDYNSGDSNSGHYNSGDYNSGNRNSGDFNSGDSNSGYYNSGYYNSGNRNSGNFNSGDYNSGNRNSGNYNSGYFNSGIFNSGSSNSGDFNSGHSNSGSSNSGSYNSGDYNSGYYNSCNYSNGVFCNKEENIKIFNIDSNMTFNEFYQSKYYEALHSSPFILTKWVNYTDEEKKNSLCRQATGGYLKTYTYKEACANWWGNINKENKEIIINMPNFDKEVFKDITGIEV